MVELLIQLSCDVAGDLRLDISDPMNFDLSDEVPYTLFRLSLEEILELIRAKVVQELVSV